MSLESLAATTTQCVFCPNLCLHACPASTAGGSDAHSPWAKMSLLRWMGEKRGRRQPPLEETHAENAVALYQCTSCGACQRACRHDVDVAGTLQSARETLVSSGVAPFAEATFQPPEPTAEGSVQPAGISGHRLLAAGHVRAFERWARGLSSRFTSEVTVSSVEDYRCIREDWPRHGARLRAGVRLAASSGSVPTDGRAVWFEPCHFQNDAPELEMARASVQALVSGLRPVRASDDPGMCCGGGGVYPRVSPEGAMRAARRVMDRVLGMDADTLVTACGGCAEHLRASRRDGDPDVVLLGHAEGESA